VILVVDSRAMHAAGHAFHVSANGVWLVDRVPPSFIGFPERSRLSGDQGRVCERGV
jgi:RNA:NAD 2'-phosphotransferase (TPT1/KptA family)